MLTIFAALSLVIALQVGGIKNDTSPVQENVSSTTEPPKSNGDTSNFWFSFASAIGSFATLGAFVVIMYQTRLTKKQIAQTQVGLSLTKEQLAQTQEELDNTIRPWIGILQTHGKDIGFSIDFHDIGKLANVTAEYFLKNYGRVPARIISKRYKWSKKRISENELYSEKIPDEWSSSRLQSLIFPDEDGKSSTDSDEQSFLVSPNETFYFGLLIEYDSGEGTRKREFGSIIECKERATSCLNRYSWTESDRAGKSTRII
jgi:hypothetical protein